MSTVNMICYVLAEHRHSMGTAFGVLGLCGVGKLGLLDSFTTIPCCFCLVIVFPATILRSAPR